jgi:lipopolysaccharide/colanic/teichoic acid biosynthesis glycosyltransferase
MIHEERSDLQIRYFIERLFVFSLLVLSLPVLFLIWLAIKLEDDESVLFKQNRMGKDKKPFVMYKFRTMVVGAEELKGKYLHLNEADGPVFKIYNDPRNTRVGRFLARTGLDELPQFINIIKGEMALVGPRPLPIDEARRVPKKYEKRFSVLPGITSLWVVRGSHQLSFDEWMKLDLQYVENRSPWQDLSIMLLTGLLMGKWMFYWLLKRR